MMQRPHAEETPILLHLHIPKTAGMALNDCIFEIYRSAEWDESEQGFISGVYYYPAGIDTENANETARHILSRKDVRAVVGHFGFGLHESIERPYEYVTLLRHPVDRVISLYHHIKKWDNEVLNEEVVTRDLSVTEFVQDLDFVELDNGQTRRIAGAQPPFGKCDKDILEQAQWNLANEFAVVGLTERFAESVVLMKDRLGWSSVPKLRWKNVNRLRPSRDALSPETIAAIVDKNKLDLQLYAFAERQLFQQIEAEGGRLRDDFAMVKQSLEDEARRFDSMVRNAFP